MKTLTNYHDFTTKRMSSKKRLALDVGDWWMNRIQCNRCNDIITSNNRHDYKYCSCKGVFVDGGSWYLRRGGDFHLVHEMSEKFTYPHPQD